MRHGTCTTPNSFKKNKLGARAGAHIIAGEKLWIATANTKKKVSEITAGLRPTNQSSWQHADAI